MSRVAQTLNKIKNLTVLVPLAVLIVGFVGAATSWNAQPKASFGIEQKQTTYVAYQGIESQTALDLLKKYADVQTKHYSFGDLVTAINGTPGNGPKYWSFYVNGKLAEVGAGAYVTHDSDQIEWKLQ